MDTQNLIIDGIKWHVRNVAGVGEVQPLCPKHHLRLSLDSNNYNNCFLKCAECDIPYKFSREFNEQKQYILDKIDSKVFRNMKFINLDDEAIPISEIKISSDDNKYFTTALLTKSKVGLRLVVYAGEKGKTEKTQIFVEPEIKRLAFDQTNLHPSDVFLKLEGTFDDGSSMIIKKPEK